MAPNDDPFDGAKPQGEPTPSQPAPPTPTPGATPDQIAEQLNEFGTKLGAELRGFGTQVADAIQQVRGETPPGETPPDPSTLANDVTQRLLTGDLSVLDERVKTVLKETLGPYLTNSLADRQTEVRERLEHEVEDRFGEGSWEKFISTDLERAIEALPVEARGSAAHIKATVDGIIGSKHEAMYEFRTEAVKKAQEAQKDNEMNAPRMLNTSRARPATPKGYEDDSAEFVKHYEEESGKKLDLGYLFKVRQHRERGDGVYRLEDFPTIQEDANKGGAQ